MVFSALATLIAFVVRLPSSIYALPVVPNIVPLKLEKVRTRIITIGVSSCSIESPVIA